MIYKIDINLKYLVVNPGRTNLWVVKKAVVNCWVVSCEVVTSDVVNCWVVTCEVVKTPPFKIRRFVYKFYL